MTDAFRYGDFVLVVDHRGREHLVELVEGAVVEMAAGRIATQAIVGVLPGVALETSSGKRVVLLRPTLADAVVHMPRGAQVIYPKDAVAILEAADVGPGLRVLECGVGSGGLTLWLARMGASVTAVERRADFARLAEKNLARFGDPSRVRILLGELDAVALDGPYDRVLLDMVDPWSVIRWIGAELDHGGRLAAYVTNALQLHETAAALEAAGFVRIEVREVLERRWVARGEVVRPELRMVAHTGFIVAAAVTPRAIERARGVRRRGTGAAEESGSGTATPDSDSSSHHPEAVDAPSRTDAAQSGWAPPEW